MLMRYLRRPVQLAVYIGVSEDGLHVLTSLGKRNRFHEFLWIAIFPLAQPVVHPVGTGWTTGWARGNIAIHKNSWNLFRLPRLVSTCRPSSETPMYTASCTGRRRYRINI